MSGTSVHCLQTREWTNETKKRIMRIIRRLREMMRALGTMEEDEGVKSLLSNVRDAVVVEQDRLETSEHREPVHARHRIVRHVDCIELILARAVHVMGLIRKGWYRGQAHHVQERE